MRRAVIFDLDGTLLDSLEDLADAGNAVLKAFGYPQHPAAAYKIFVGDGLDTLMKRALPAGAAEKMGDNDFKRVVDRLREVYGAAWNIKSRPYDGVPELLAALVKCENLELGLLSNKPHDWTMAIVDYYFSGVPFASVRGAGAGMPLKPDPAAALAMSAGFGLEPGNCFFVGDSNVDMRTAVRAGMTPIGVSWGFRGEAELIGEGARFIARSPLEILKIVTSC